MNLARAQAIVGKKKKHHYNKLNVRFKGIETLEKKFYFKRDDPPNTKRMNEQEVFSY